MPKTSAWVFSLEHFFYLLIFGGILFDVFQEESLMLLPAYDSVIMLVSFGCLMASIRAVRISQEQALVWRLRQLIIVSLYAVQANWALYVLPTDYIGLFKNYYLRGVQANQLGAPTISGLSALLLLVTILFTSYKQSSQIDDRSACTRARWKIFLSFISGAILGVILFNGFVYFVAAGIQ